MNNNKLDSQWFTELHHVCIDEVLYFRVPGKDNAVQRRHFIQNEIENPELHYEHLAGMPFGDIETRLKNLRGRIQDEEKNEVVCDLYTRKIENQILRYQLLKHSSRGDDHAFTHTSSLLYGSAERKMYAYVCTRIDAKIAVHAEVLPRTSLHTLEKTVSRFRNDTHVIEPLQCVSADPESIVLKDANHARDIFRTTLLKYHIPNWKVVIDDTGVRSRFSVSQMEQTVYVPATEHLERRLHPLTELNVRALAEHEIGVHVRRREEARKSPLRLLEIGLDRYIKGEEGVAAYYQQRIEGSAEYYGIDRYFALSLALGIDGTPRDFRGVFEIMYEYYILELADTYKDEEFRMSNAAHVAFEVCMRIFRGTTGKSCGVAFTRDNVYLVGNIDIWALVGQNPLFEKYFLLGKYDPTNERHIEALAELEILTFER
jgi:hypothetical protein